MGVCLCLCMCVPLTLSLKISCSAARMFAPLPKHLHGRCAMCRRAEIVLDDACCGRASEPQGACFLLAGCSARGRPAPHAPSWWVAGSRSAGRGPPQALRTMASCRLRLYGGWVWGRRHFGRPSPCGQVLDAFLWGFGVWQWRAARGLGVRRQRGAQSDRSAYARALFVGPTLRPSLERSMLPRGASPAWVALVLGLLMALV